MRLGGETITIVHPAPKDAFGDPESDAPGPETVTGCSVQPRTTAEQTDQRDTATQTLTAWLPPGTNVAATDRLGWNGDLYEVDGTPMSWNDHRGRAHHIEVPLRIVKG